MRRGRSIELLLDRRLISDRRTRRSAILDVTANLDSKNRIDDLFQPVTSLQDRFAGNITPITPKQIEETTGAVGRFCHCCSS
jgi:hypothetical protein